MKLTADDIAAIDWLAKRRAQEALAERGGYEAGRGKRPTPVTRSTWDMRGASTELASGGPSMATGKSFDPQLGSKILNEALKD